MLPNDNILADAKSTPSYYSDLHFSIFQNRPHRGVLICSKICVKSSKLRIKVQMAYARYICTVFFTFFWHLSKKPKLCSPGLETGCEPVLFISDRYCHYKSDNYILLPINVGPRN